MENEELLQERTLTVTSYAEVEGNYAKKRVTIALHQVLFVIAGEEDYEVVDGVELRLVNVMIGSGDSLELFISVLDLMTLERAVGAYFLA